MREILFRGKRVDNGEWVEGSFVDLGCVIVAPTIDGKNVSIYGSRPTSFQVIRGTIGQFTGMYDAHKRRIFEGDIVNGCAFNGSYQYGKVTYFRDRFVVYPISKHAEGYAYLDNTYRGDIEVIGNIHDKED